jgi:hypothetical protein
MKILYKGIIICILLVTFSACQKQWLERTPQTIITDAQLWGDPNMVLGLLANYYDQLPTDQDIDGNRNNMAAYDDAMWSGYSGNDGLSNLTWNNGAWYWYSWGLMRNINLAIDNIAKFSPTKTPAQVAQNAQFTAELRFLRALVTFEMLKREGGVPIITKQLIYDYSGDPKPLQVARSKESDCYDFIASEMDAIQATIGNVTNGVASQTRANKYTCLALKCRAMLYAGSIAKYNALFTPTVTTPGGEVGIPASMANAYYQKALDAANLIINSGLFALYNSNPDKAQNFYDAISKKGAANKEVILVRDYLTAKAKRHSYAYDNIPRSIREDNLGSSCITPSLNYVEAFDYLDGSKGTLKDKTADGTDFIYYTNLQDIFANKDARLAGTVIYPGATFKGLNVDIQAGVKVWNAATSTYSNVTSSTLGSAYTDGKTLTGAGGPHASIQEVTNTGFYIKKFLDQGAGTSTRGILSDMWWVRFRLGEVYLNAAEAAFELGQTSVSLPFINAIRQRAGFPANSLDATTLTLAKIQNERRCELAFEDHRLWDLKRWRIAHTLWNNDPNSMNDFIWALYPYRVVRPGDPLRDGKYVFEKIKAPRFRGARYFQLYNYYSAMNQGDLNNNPLLVKNPFQ